MTSILDSAVCNKIGASRIGANLRHWPKATAWLCGLAITGGAVALWPAISSLAVVSVGALAALMVAPRRTLPAIAIVAFALIPVKQLPFPGEPATLNPGMVVIIVWCVRLLPEMLSSRATTVNTPKSRWTLAVLACILLTSSLNCSLPLRSLLWTFSFAVLALLPIYLFQLEPDAAAPAVRAWIYIGGLLACYAIAEHIAKGNPLDHFYRSARQPLLQVWSTYRVTTTIGHPLVNGAFFSVAAILAAAEFLEGRRRLMLACTVLCMLAIGATASRGALLSVAVASPCVVGISISTRLRTRRSLGIVVGTVALFGVLLVISAGPLLQRNSSIEGSSSAQTRVQTIRDGIPLLRTAPVLGVGPGVADDLKRANATGRNRAGGLENSWLALLVAVGIPGFALTCLLIWTALSTAIRDRRATAVGAVVAYVSVAGSFKLFEGDRPALIMFGTILGICMAESRTDATRALELDDRICA